MLWLVKPSLRQTFRSYEAAASLETTGAINIVLLRSKEPDRPNHLTFVL